MSSVKKPQVNKTLINEVQVPSWNDPRGNLFVFEKETVPFQMKRVYYLANTAPNFSRGFHAHKNLRQIAVAVSGSCRMVLDDGTNREEIILNSPSKGVLIESMIWREMHDFSADCVLLVLASEHYDKSDYIREYDDFLKAVKP